MFVKGVPVLQEKRGDHCFCRKWFMSLMKNHASGSVMQRGQKVSVRGDWIWILAKNLWKFLNLTGPQFSHP